MRHESTVALAPGRDATILEARVRDMRRLITLLPEEGAAIDLLALVRERLPDVLALLSDCLRLPEGETIDDLPLSESEVLVRAWWEMHADFFARALDAAGLEVVTWPPDTAPSTAPVSH